MTLFPSSMPCWLAALPTVHPPPPRYALAQRTAPGDRKAVGLGSGDSLRQASSFLTLKALLPNLPLGLRPILKSSSL